MTTEQAIFEKVRELSSEKQQDVLAFIEYLNTDEWQQRYQRRFRQLQQEVRVGIEAADRGRDRSEKAAQSCRRRFPLRSAPPSGGPGVCATPRQ